MPGSQRFVAASFADSAQKPDLLAVALVLKGRLPKNWLIATTSLPLVEFA
jgi:hypothetical protein